MSNLRLPQSEIESLMKAYRQEKYKKEAVRINCVIAWAKGWDWASIEDILMVSNDFISENVRKYKAGGIDALVSNNYSGNNYKLSDKEEEEIKKFVSNSFIPDSKLVIKYVKERFGIIYSKAGMVKLLRRLNFVYKQPKKIPGKHPDCKIQQEFIEEIQQIMHSCKDPQNKQAIYFLDGSGFYHNANPGYGWIEKGKNKLFKTNTSRQKINVNGAYNPIDQQTICIEQQESVNQESNIKLVEKIINQCEYKTYYLVLDNAKYNYGNMFVNYIQQIEKTKNIKLHLIYLPPYSPNLNLIERLWKYAKKTLLYLYYEKFSEFVKGIIDFFERQIKEEFHKLNLAHFIGRKLHTI